MATLAQRVISLGVGLSIDLTNGIRMRTILLLFRQKFPHYLELQNRAQAELKV